MEVKRCSHIIWDDLPGVESPQFARREIERRFRDGPIGIRHIWGMDELLRDRRPGLLGSPDTRQVMDWFLERIDDGTFVLVYAPHERPVHPALCWEKGARKARSSRWQILHHAEHERGQPQSPQLAGAPDGHWIADPQLPMLPRLHIEEWIERGCGDRALNCGLPEISWWDRLLGGNREVEERFIPKALGTTDARKSDSSSGETLTKSGAPVEERVIPTRRRAEQASAPVREAGNPPTSTLPKTPGDCPKQFDMTAMNKDFDQQWANSFPGGVSQEQGGTIVSDGSGALKLTNTMGGTSGSFSANLVVGANERVEGIFHTHPYDQSEGGHTGVSLSRVLINK